MIQTALYSFWSKPIGDEGVGFNSLKSFAACATLSVLLARQQFKQVKLVTDTKGKALLIDKLQLPFDRVSLSLDDKMKNVNRAHWALTKLHALDEQWLPTMHLDFDVLWFDKPPLQMLTADWSFQSYEGAGWEEGYREMLRLTKEGFTSRYSCMNGIDYDRQHAYNCGVIGTNGLGEVGAWLTLAKEWLKWWDSEARPANLCTGLFFEQYLIAHQVERKGDSVATLETCCPDVEPTFDNLVNVIAPRLGYAHLMAESKRNPLIEEAVSTKLGEWFPHQKRLLESLHL